MGVNCYLFHSTVDECSVSLVLEGLKEARSRCEVGEVERRSHAATGAAMALPESWGSKRRGRCRSKDLERITGLWLGGDETKSLSRRS